MKCLFNRIIEYFVDLVVVLLFWIKLCNGILIINLLWRQADSRFRMLTKFLERFKVKALLISQKWVISFLIKNYLFANWGRSCLWVELCQISKQGMEVSVSEGYHF